MSPNLVHVVVATLATFVAGWGWYTVFGKMFQKEHGVSEAEVKKAKEQGMQGMGKGSAIELVGTFLMAYVLGHFLILLNITDLQGALQLAFWSWVGFKLPGALSQVALNKKTWRTVFLELQTLVGLSVMAAVLTFMK